MPRAAHDALRARSGVRNLYRAAWKGRSWLKPGDLTPFQPVGRHF
jgi:hypothetical protein